MFVSRKSVVSLKSLENYNTTVRALQGAIDEWNATRSRPDDPRPLFRKVETKLEATCIVKIRGTPEARCREPRNGETLAQAFFPDREPVITLYTPAFAEPHVDFLKNVLCHELVHVQGVRHYFAVREDREHGLLPSVEVGEKDELSVSNYVPLEHMQIRATDVEALSTLYARKHEAIGGLPVVYHTALPLSNWRGDGSTSEDDDWQFVNYPAKKAE